MVFKRRFPKTIFWARCADTVVIVMRHVHLLLGLDCPSPSLALAEKGKSVNLCPVQTKPQVISGNPFLIKVVAFHRPLSVWCWRCPHNCQPGGVSAEWGCALGSPREFVDLDLRPDRRDDQLRARVPGDVRVDRTGEGSRGETPVRRSVREPQRIFIDGAVQFVEGLSWSVLSYCSIRLMIKTGSGCGLRFVMFYTKYR